MPYVLIYLKSGRCVVFRYATHSVSEYLHPRSALRLQGRLDRVDGSQDHPERSSSNRRESRLDQRRQVLHVRIGVQERENPGVCGRVPESGDGSLYERGAEALVVPCPAAIMVECVDSCGRGCSVAVLVIHHRAQRLEAVRRAAVQRCLSLLTMSVNTCRTIANVHVSADLPNVEGSYAPAAPLRPPPSAFFNAFFKSNYVVDVGSYSARELLENSHRYRPHQ